MDWVLFLGMVAVLLSGATIVLALKLVKRKKPVWAYTTRRIIGRDTDAAPELQISFQGRVVDNVYRTVLILCNMGAETVKQTDVAETVTIHFEGASILRPPTTLAMPKEANRLSARLIGDGRDDAVQIDFRYLDRGDGIAVEVLHTEAEGIRCSGVIVGTDKIRYVGELAADRTAEWERLTVSFCGLIGGGAVYFGMRQLADPSMTSASRGLIGLLFGAVILGFIMVGLVCYTVIVYGNPVRVPGLSRPNVPSWVRQLGPLIGK